MHGTLTRETLAGTLRVLAPHLPDALVPAGALDAVHAVADRLPAALTGELYLECRLAAGEPRVDLVVHVQDAGRALLAGAGTDDAFPDGLAAAPAWRRIRAFCAEWATPASPLHRQVPAIWLELDVDPALGGAEEPGVFVHFGWLNARGPSPSAWAAAAADAVGALTGEPVPAATRAALERCVSALPAGAAPLYAGVFPGRPDGALRLCASGLVGEAAHGWLRAVGVELDAASRALLANVGPGAAPGLVHLDVGVGGVSPRVGVEVPLHRRGQLHGEIREWDALARLAAAGVADGGKVAALAAWPGWSAGELPHEPGVTRLVVRRVNHLKLVLEAGKEPEAKAYLCVFHTPRQRQTEAPQS